LCIVYIGGGIRLGQFNQQGNFQLQASLYLKFGPVNQSKIHGLEDVQTWTAETSCQAQDFYSKFSGQLGQQEYKTKKGAAHGFGRQEKPMFRYQGSTTHSWTFFRQ